MELKKHGCTDVDIRRYMEEFMEKEKMRGQKVDAEKARQELAEIN